MSVHTHSSHPQSSDDQGPVSPTSGKMFRTADKGKRKDSSQPPLSSENDDGANQLK